MSDLQTRSHEVLLKLLNNIGIVGAVLTAIVDILLTVVFIVGVDINIDANACIVFAVVNACVGILINTLLRYQGQKYAEIENQDICDKFYNKQAKEKKYIPFWLWNIIQFIKDILIKGCTVAFSIGGALYLTIEGSKNPIQLLFTLTTLVLFTCFGLISMNSSYYRFYNIQIPYMQKEINKNGNV